MEHDDPGVTFDYCLEIAITSEEAAWNYYKRGDYHAARYFIDHAWAWFNDAIRLDPRHIS